MIRWRGMMKELRFVFLWAVVAALVVACGDKDAGSKPDQVISEMHAQLTVPQEYASLVNPVAATPETVTAGEQIFRVNCASCHGEAGKGDGAASRALNPRPGDLSLVASMVDDSYLFWRISDGGAELKTAMPAWKKILTEEQIWQGVLYIRSLAAR
jgi:mono/diheme cytochrome c family protein